MRRCFPCTQISDGLEMISILDHQGKISPFLLSVRFRKVISTKRSNGQSGDIIRSNCLLIFSRINVGDGIQWSSINRHVPNKHGQSRSIAEVYQTMLLLTVIYFLLGFYCNAVYPSFTTQSKPLLFILKVNGNKFRNFKSSIRDRGHLSIIVTNGILIRPDQKLKL